MTATAQTYPLTETKPASSPSAPFISLRGVSKSFGDHHVLDNVDLDVARGETLVVIGRSGAGKSILLKLVAGLMRPDSGTVTINGERLDQIDREGLMRLRLRIGFVFQGGALFDSMTIAENIGLRLREHMRLHPLDVRAIIEDCLEWVGLVGLGDSYPSQLSGGMRKRASLARAIAMSPQIVLYDEPTTGLDPITAAGINDLMVSLREKMEVTAIAVTHDMNSAFKIADRIAFLHEGRIVFDGSVEAARNTTDPLLRHFIDGDTDVGPNP